MPLKYHQKSAELLGITPRISPSQVALIDSLEEKYKVKFPASLREWYSVEDNFALLEKILGNHIGIRLDDAPRVQADCGYLINGTDPFILVIENQSVWFMAVRFDEGEDPPVYIRYNEPDELWVLHTHSFSDWIEALSWDYFVFSGLDFSSAEQRVLVANGQNRERLLEFQPAGPETYVCNVWFTGLTLARMKKGQELLLVIHMNDGA